MPDQYHVGSGFSEQELEFASWWVRHGHFLQRLGLGFLVFLSVAFWGYTLWSILDGYIISQPREARIVQNILQNGLTQETYATNAPQPLLPSEVAVLPGTDNRQDLLVELSNSNAAWWAEFNYRFDLNGEQTPMRKGYILPQSQRYLTELGWKGKGQALGAQLIIDNLVWHRVLPQQVERNYQAFSERRMQLRFDDVAYSKDLTIGTQTVGQTTFTLNNPTGFGFWSADVTIILYRLDNKVAFTTINVKDIKPGESRPMTVNWFDNLTGISKTEVHADVNLLDPSAYLPGQRF